MMTQKEMVHLVRSQLAIDLNCATGDLGGEKDNLVFVEAKENPGRRPFPRRDRYFEIVSMGRSIVVSATPERLAIAKARMQGKDRDTIFALPFIRGLSLYFLPDIEGMKPVPPPDSFSFEIVEQDQVSRLLAISGFDNALIYNPNHPYHTALVMVASQSGRVVGMAGACDVCATWRQIGIDVLPEYRSLGLASYLVSSLTARVLEDGYVPVYGTISSNVASQRVAHRAGYYPAWVSDWRVDFKGLETR